MITACNNGSSSANSNNHSSTSTNYYVSKKSLGAATSPEYITTANSSTNTITIYKVTTNQNTTTLEQVQQISTFDKSPQSVTVNENTKEIDAVASDGTIIKIDQYGNETSSSIPQSLNTQSTSFKSKTNISSSETSGNFILYSSFSGLYFLYLASTNQLYEFKNNLQSTPTLVNTDGYFINGAALCPLNNCMMTINTNDKNEEVSQIDSNNLAPIGTNSNIYETNPYGAVYSSDQKFAYIIENVQQKVNIYSVSDNGTLKSYLGSINTEGAPISISTYGLYV